MLGRLLLYKLPGAYEGALGCSGRLPSCRRAFSSNEPEAGDPNKIIPSKPTWSLLDLISQSPQDVPSPPVVTSYELHHLLRLSALPLPKSSNEEQKMLRDLQSQLHFVRAIQNVDIPDDVEPLQSIRDETEAAMKEEEYTVETLAEEFTKEEVVGKRGRIRRKTTDLKIPGEEEVREENWDPLKLAPRTVGRYVAVDTAKD
ncbi:MAG: hypothetical protein LQ345_004506 [Seirophora villosa]|nr:MAG: hypothetical protein LQ345_004506 [Seirophora villosa]